jgi:hypothetical protein
MKYAIRFVTGLALAVAGCGGDDGGAPVTPVCGDGVADPGEDCATCPADVTGCEDPDPVCGNGVAEDGEACDGDDLAGATCASLGFSAGPLACGDCAVDASACCNDFCVGDVSECMGDVARTCVTQASGCRAWQVTDCAAGGDVCDDSGAAAACVCIDRCPSAGFARCDGTQAETCVMEADGCLDWRLDMDCATQSLACAVAPEGPVCVVDASGESCADPYPVVDGRNVIGWSATASDYLTAQPSCNTSTLTGPDVVLSYTATVDGIATVVMHKPASARQVMVVSSSACGTVTPELACLADTTPTSLTDTFAVAAGTTYYLYVRDTTTGTAPLDSPFILDVDEVACASFTNATSNLQPANGAVLATASPVLSVDLQHPANPNVGVITITGDGGTSLSYDLSTSQTAVTFTNDGRTVVIDPAVAFAPGETLTVSWSGVVDPFCAAPIAPPTWSFRILSPSCTPGTGGMVGRTTTRVATGLGTFTESYVAADTSPTGYVYVGGTSNLYRLPKAGGPVENVVEAAGITTTPLGSTMAIVGGKIFTVDTTTSTTTPFLWRLSISGGVTWSPLGYGQWPSTPGDIVRGVFHDDGRLYLVTDETTTGVATQIWSINTSAVLLPAEPRLEGTVPGAEDCDSIAGDDTYFYLTCATGDRLLRVHRTTFASELVTDTIDLSLTNNQVHAHDLDDDGHADVLYVVSDEERVHYVCDPDGAAPFWRDVLVEYGSGTASANYGLGFDPVGRALWAFDDDTLEFVKIQ